MFHRCNHNVRWETVSDPGHQVFNPALERGKAVCKGAAGGNRVAVNRRRVGQPPVNVFSAIVTEGQSSAAALSQTVRITSKTVLPGRVNSRQFLLR